MLPDSEACKGIIFHTALYFLEDEAGSRTHEMGRATQPAPGPLCGTKPQRSRKVEGGEDEKVCHALPQSPDTHFSP